MTDLDYRRVSKGQLQRIRELSRIVFGDPDIADQLLASSEIVDQPTSAPAASEVIAALMTVRGEETRGPVNAAMVAMFRTARDRVNPAGTAQLPADPTDPDPPTTSAGGKTCKTCGKTKPFGEFHRNKNSRDGYAYSCKPCVSAKSKAHYRKRTRKQDPAEPDQPAEPDADSPPPAIRPAGGVDQPDPHPAPGPGRSLRAHPRRDRCGLRHLVRLLRNRRA